MIYCAWWRVELRTVFSQALNTEAGGGEIYRVLEKDAFFLSSHSDLQRRDYR